MTGETQLFNYLRNIIFKEDAGNIEIGELPESLRELGQGLQMLSVWMKEVKQLSSALSEGKLDTALPSVDNPLADPLKALHATMKHITWQAQQISKGDYSQRVDFLGAFSEAFNSMTQQLADREADLEKSRDDALQATELLQKVTDRFGNYVVVIGQKKGEDLYENAAFRTMKKERPLFAEALRIRMQDQMRNPDGADEIWEFYLESSVEFSKEMQIRADGWYFQVETQFVSWAGKDAAVHIIEDISEERMKRKVIENLAYFDALTGLYNRSYIMRELEAWLEGNFSFCLAFIDLDNLKFANDEVGHAEGDQYIRQAASLISEEREERRLARIGGDEFLLMAKDCTERELAEELEAKRNSFLLQSKDEGLIYRKSFSYGIVNVDALGERYRSALLREADRRMYQYKLAHKPKISKRL
ncbi:diguanylate cyclase domain-containing protein [Zhenpiania hominis]|uniref:Diguanylate cyclase n=1 Tax=Zhenpiania hominis TaxID=2763644 RepID=A0A923NMK6_9FIRM|nr:diguanylate cyclase [Zhenpiania hominis]MBC6679922.1 diguanylate cyclase [Zhenpiania hominis]